MRYRFSTHSFFFAVENQRSQDTFIPEPYWLFTDCR